MVGEEQGKRGFEFRKLNIHPDDSDPGCHMGCYLAWRISFARGLKGSQQGYRVGASECCIGHENYGLKRIPTLGSTQVAAQNT